MRRAGIIILIAVLLFSLAFGGEGDVDASMRLLGPSSSHPFGTDALGRDLLERTAGGAFVSISIGAISLLISAAVGTVLAYAYSLPRFPRSTLLALADTFKAVPPMVLALFFAAFAGPGIAKMAIAVSIAHISDISRTAHSRTAALLNEEFIEAERSKPTPKRKRQAEEEIARMNYQQTILEAGQEVSDALHLYDATNRRLMQDKQQVEQLEKASAYTKDLFQSGDASYLEVLTAQQSLLSAQLTEVSDNVQRMQAVISLYSALGGGR